MENASPSFCAPSDNCGHLLCLLQVEPVAADFKFLTITTVDSGPEDVSDLGDFHGSAAQVASEFPSE